MPQLDQETCTTCFGLDQSGIIWAHNDTVTFNSQYKPQMNCTQHHSVMKLTSRRFFIMDATDYSPFARVYSIWNAAVAALQFLDGRPRSTKAQ